MELRSQKRRREDTINTSGILEEGLVSEMRNESERRKLEALTDQQLQEEAWRCRLAPRETREATIDLVMTHFESNSSLVDAVGQPRPSAAGGPLSSQQSADPGGAPPMWDATAEALERLTTAMTICIQQQQQVLASGPLSRP